MEMQIVSAKDKEDQSKCICQTYFYRFRILSTCWNWLECWNSYTQVFNLWKEYLSASNGLELESRPSQLFYTIWESTDHKLEFKINWRWGNKHDTISGCKWWYSCRWVRGDLASGMWW